MLKQEFVEKEGIVSISATEVSGTAYNCSTCTAMFTDPNAFMDHITNGHIGWNDIQFCMFLFLDFTVKTFLKSKPKFCNLIKYLPRSVCVALHTYLHTYQNVLTSAKYLKFQNSLQ